MFTNSTCALVYNDHDFNVRVPVIVQNTYRLFKIGVVWNVGEITLWNLVAYFDSHVIVDECSKL